ncbi:MAG: fibronectin type III domain-containing protein, partial [Lachnospiraceae bacterium]|nr:fibronectin type III domain-containing protein [Lachnospiraceae bacterium]
MRKESFVKRLMALVIAVTIFFCDSNVAEAAGNISLATASTQTYGNNDEVWSFVETSGYGSEAKLPIYLKDKYYDGLKELCPRIKGNGDGTVTIKWNPIAGTKEYEISLTDDSKNKYEFVCYNHVKNTSYTFEMKGTPAIGPYYLQIKALDSSENALVDTHFLTVHFPDYINKCETLPEPSDIEAKVNGTSVTIQFKRVPYAKDYTVLFDGKEYAVTKNPSSSGLYSLTINNLVPEKDYKYAVRANFHSQIGKYTTILPKYDYKSIPGVYGQTRSTATIQKPVGTPKINSKSATETSVTVSWSAATNAAAYDLS